MSGYLWKYYLEDDVDSFRHILEQPSHSTRPGAQKGFVGWQGGSLGAAVNSSPGSYGASPILSTKGRKPMGQAAVHLTRSDINSRDGTGLTILHQAASSSLENAIAFAQILLDHPFTDLYIQDAENGWTALHRAFYFGNIAIARMILNRDAQDILGHGSGGYNQHARGLVKIKDKEGYGPLDLFSMTIKDRTLRPEEGPVHDTDSDDEVAHGDSGDRDDEARKRVIVPLVSLGGDEAYTFGSNKNVTLGFGDQDDRQFPERIILRRPDHLLQRFYHEHHERQVQSWASLGVSLQTTEALRPKAIADLPINIRHTPIIIQDFEMSKLHTAVLTTDPVSNLYMCGHGPGGRLGTGNETTRYQFTCIEGGGLAQKKVSGIALGQNHTLAITDEGEIYSWGNNAFGQLGYTLPKPSVKDDDPISTIPRQIFGPLKREIIIGIAASRIHSVAHTTASLYTFGKNEGQLGIVDSDARSLEIQVIPRKIAASLFASSITSVSAIEGATICLLETREVWVFANYGYARLNFPLDGFTNYFLKESWLTTKYESTPNRISKITSGGDTICALSTSGEVFTVSVSRRSEPSLDSSTSTTNPKQIRGALSQPYRIWSSKRAHMAARDVGVDQDGSIILTTDAGSVWRRTKRATIKNATAARIDDYRPKDYKFLRVPGLTRVIAVRASAFGAYAAIRKDCNVTKTQIGVDEPLLWKDVAPLLSFHELSNYEESSDDENPSPRFWQRPSNAQSLRKRALKSKDLEAEIIDILHSSMLSSGRSYDLELSTTLSDLRIPAHEFILSGRSRVFRNAMIEFRTTEGTFDMQDIMSLTRSGDRTTVTFQGLDFLTVFNLTLYAYTDSIVDFWNVTRQFPKMAYRYRLVRTELMRIASRLELRQLEPAVRQMVNPRKSLNMDMQLAVKNPSFFESGNIIVELADGEMSLHSDIICQRCPFFDGLFRGRAGGQWLSSRRTEESKQIRIDLKHVETRLFELVVRHIYADAGEELFDEVNSEDLNDSLALEELLDHIMDVMSVANELMLDRLSQICQRLIGHYVNARNVCSLLNAIAPSSVSEFKDAALEYVCLSLEAVMQNGSLDELDDDLILELNQVVRDNQLATLPFARSGRAEAILFDKYPELAERIERGKRAKIDAIVLSNKFSDSDGIVSSSFRAQSLEELSTSPLRQRNRRKTSRETKPGADSPHMFPALKDKNSVPDLIFEMSDEEEEEEKTNNKIQPSQFTSRSASKHPIQTPIGSPDEAWSEVRRKSRSSSHGLGIEETTTPQLPGSMSPIVTKEMRAPGRPWGSTPLGGAKLDLKDIMAQASSDKPSGLTLGLSGQAIEEQPSASFQAKMSQKERKRLHQAQQLGQPATIEKPQPTPPTVSPWQAMSQRKPTPINSPAMVTPSQPSRTPSTPQLTMRQTVANSGITSKQKESQPSQPSRSASRSIKSLQTGPASALGPGMSVSTNPIPTPHSVRHIPLPSHSSTSPNHHLSMNEILSQQLAEKNYVRDAAAKRSLQEIQQEQEFQEWWDQESKRVIQEEEQKKRADERAAKVNRSRPKGRGGRGKNKGKDKKDVEEDSERGKGSRDVGGTFVPHESTVPKSIPEQEGGERGRGRGKGYRGSRGGGRGGRTQGPAKDGPAAQAIPKEQHGAP
ncbi:uncharacterized protein BDR25DRAFT_231544 [Lindgomyces ingoldianus]|uniref:Uncharacterized protein n=1 Tax=Lindgomyces ingoldianus TaxID=673940 RepID=A0ACB6QND2_9PLEO|nr:uncharacterized protein BDR25DRAFT_231544 [Lindgomyces ingoldianus]KAF2468489.1 hypothetical protein BDR25DRAFT_231544 [Lindgomyces ingoldianus]